MEQPTFKMVDNDEKNMVNETRNNVLFDIHFLNELYDPGFVKRFSTFSLVDLMKYREKLFIRTYQSMRLKVKRLQLMDKKLYKLRYTCNQKF